ncbi:MAG: hypothetical protein GXC94_02055 [Comamonadaceae bacterium]|nr:hypothetical protein [Comamonadaceae bacterium]
MALLSDFTTPHGAPARYHRLLRVEHDFAAGTSTLVFQVYVDEEARRDGKQPLWHEYLAVPLEDLDEDPRLRLYPFAAGYREGYLLGAAGDTQGTDEAPVP